MKMSAAASLGYINTVSAILIAAEADVFELDIFILSSPILLKEDAKDDDAKNKINVSWYLSISFISDFNTLQDQFHLFG